MSASIQAGLIKAAISMAFKSGLKVWGVTCDTTLLLGILSTMSQLGCKFNGSNAEILEWLYVPKVVSKACIMY